MVHGGFISVVQDVMMVIMSKPPCWCRSLDELHKSGPSKPCKKSYTGAFTHIVSTNHALQMQWGTYLQDKDAAGLGLYV